MQTIHLHVIIRAVRAVANELVVAFSMEDDRRSRIAFIDRPSPGRIVAAPIFIVGNRSLRLCNKKVSGETLFLKTVILFENGHYCESSNIPDQVSVGTETRTDNPIKLIAVYFYSVTYAICWL